MRKSCGSCITPDICFRDNECGYGIVDLRPDPPFDFNRYLNFGREAAATEYQNAKGQKLSREMRNRLMIDAAVINVLNILRAEGKLKT